MIEGFNHVGSEHKCSICSSDYTNDEGGVQGYFGIMPVSFCVWCYSSMVDMVKQELDITDEEIDFVQQKRIGNEKLINNV